MFVNYDLVEVEDVKKQCVTVPSKEELEEAKAWLNSLEEKLNESGI